MPQLTKTPEPLDVPGGNSNETPDLQRYKRALDERATDLEALREELSREQSEFAASSERFISEANAQVAELNAQRDKLSSDMSAHLQAAKDLAEDARDFEVRKMREHVDLIEDLGTEVQRGRESVEKLLDGVQSAETKFLAAVDEHSEAFGERLANITARAEDLEAKSFALSLREAKVEVAEDAEQRWGQQLHDAVERAAESAQGRVSELEAELEQLRTEKLTVLKDLLDARNTAEMLPQLQTRVDRLVAERDQLEQTIEAFERNTGIEETQVQDVRRTNIDLQLQLDALKAELHEATNAVNAGNRAQADLQLAHDKITYLESVRSALRMEIENLKKDFDDLVDRREARVPFPGCTAMDTDESLAQAPRTGTSNAEFNLKALCHFLQSVSQSRRVSGGDSMTPTATSFTSGCRRERGPGESIAYCWAPPCRKTAWPW